MLRSPLSQALVLTLTVLTLTVLTLPAAAAPEDDRWQLRLAGAWVDPDVTFSDIDSDGDRLALSSDGAIGLSLALERRFSRRLGVEAGALFAEPNLNLFFDLTSGGQLAVRESISFSALTAGLNIHLTPDKALDLYVGPLLVYTDYGDASVMIPGGGSAVVSAKLTSTDNFTVGAQLGADVPFGTSPWSLNLAARYIDSNLGFTDDEGVVSKVDFDPSILSVGFGYQF